MGGGTQQAFAPVALIPFEARVAGHLSVGFMLDISQLGRMDAPLLDALLIAAVLEANVNRLNRDPALQAAHAGLGSPPPDDLRRPVSINALAGSLRMPFETVRRHIKQLVRQGVLVGAAHGVYVPTEVVASPVFMATAMARYERVLGFYEDLRDAGAVEPMPFTPPPAQDPQAPVRAVGRILSDYFFRTLDALYQQIPDVVTGLLLFDIVRSSAEHLSPAQAVAALREGWSPETERTPVRVAHLSRRLGIPYETARRHVGWLVEHGFCARVGGGVVISADYLRRPMLAAATVDNLVNVRRMYRQIAALRPAMAEAAAAPAAQL